MKKLPVIIVTSALAISIGLIFWGSSNQGKAVENSEIRDGVQYVTIQAKAGYTPGNSIAKAGIPTKLVVKTNSTYDCSAALVIRSIGFQKILANTGEEVIDLGTPKTGESLKATCGMGMYNFQIQFI